MIKTNQSKASLAAKERKIIAAIGKHFTSAATLVLDGVSRKAKDVQSVLQAHLDATSAADALRVEWQTAVNLADAKGAAVAGILPDLRTHLLSIYGSSSATVADFGFTPKKRTTTVAAQATGIAKRQATRAARGTLGKKQREKIVGVVSPAPTPSAAAPKVEPQTSGATVPATTTTA